ncbi:hypothetical protein CDD83_11223 [Cordyceps sp. RAO-2017]|nr:hypothetical protein CDD83_11223 [Cordyceps sp. RAO-2017]
MAKLPENDLSAVTMRREEAWLAGSPSTRSHRPCSSPSHARRRVVRATGQPVRGTQDSIESESSDSPPLPGLDDDSCHLTATRGRPRRRCACPTPRRAR